MKILVLKDSNNKDGYVEAEMLLQPIHFKIDSAITYLESIKTKMLELAEIKEKPSEVVINVTAPSIVEKLIRPGAIRYDSINDVFRVCTKQGWRNL